VTTALDIPNPRLIQGNNACALGALAAGCRFFAGYPITPSSEIAEFMARELPKLGGKFIQMEDEIASIAAVQSILACHPRPRGLQEIPEGARRFERRVPISINPPAGFKTSGAATCG